MNYSFLWSVTLNMDYEKRWEVLADLLTEIRKKGEKPPPNVMNDLRSAKTLIEILKADSNHVENLVRIETLLGKVESYLIFVAQERFGSSYVDLWMRRLEEAGFDAAKTQKTKPKKEAANRIISGVPKGEHWIRVQTSRGTLKKDIQKLAEESGLAHKMQKNGCMLVYGRLESIKVFVKKMADKFRPTRKS